jgi:hypothetical protein
MSPWIGNLLTVSVLSLGACLIYRMAKGGRARRLASASALGIGIGVLTFIVPAPVATRGADEVVSIILCYMSMVFGMTAEYGYGKAERGETTLKFELMPFLMPIFASPIVFIPLLSLMSEEAMLGHPFTRAKLMVYLVAFQNGFFWKSFFEQRRGSARPAVQPASPPAVAAV